MRIRACLTLITFAFVLAPSLAHAQPTAPAPPPPDEPPASPPGQEGAAAGEGGDTGAESPSRKPAAGKGAVWGTVSDAATKEPIIEGQVTVVGTRMKALTDIDGNFRLELPPGTYELRVWYELHNARRIQNVRVVAGALQRVDVALEGDTGAEEVVEVEAAPDRSSAASQLLIRKNAAATGDAVSAQEIAKTPDKNAAEAARRVVGASVVGSKYVYVRGLGERYTNSLLNGTPLPSPEPDRQAVPLDLFPAVILSDLTIAKTFTPDMPGDFAGGSVRINTRELPAAFLLQGTYSISLNTAATFRERLTYPGGSLDWLGVDSGIRQLPEDLPSYKLVKTGEKPDGTRVNREELALWGRKLNAFMSTRRTTTWPNMSGNVVVGDTLRPGSQQIGYTVALTYGRRFLVRDEEEIRTFNPDPQRPGKLLKRNDYKAETWDDQVSWGGLATLAYKPHRDHQFTLTGLHSRSSDNEAREIAGFNEERGTDIKDTRLRFQSRALTFGQLAAEHTVRALGGAVLGWNVALSTATSDEPDTRENVYVRDASTGIYSFDRGTLSGSHFFSEQSEKRYGGGMDWTQPITPGDQGAKVKAGALLSLRTREFDARRFRFVPRNVNPTVLRKPPDELFTDANIGPVLELDENTRPDDAYDADHNVYAGYLMADAWVTKRIRVITGGRIEVSRQSINSFNPFAADIDPVSAELNTTDLLPALGVVIPTTKSSNLRISASKTVARPQLRELAPFAYVDYFGAREVLGNPELRRTTIYNGDLRFELFPTPSEVVAVSVFFKHFVDPIEQIIIPTSRGIVSYQNAKAARNAGAELEVRKSLDLLSPALRDFSFLGNLTLVASRVEIDTESAQNTVQTNATRPLAGQSPFVVNVGADYANEGSGTRVRVLYNVFGPRIESVGSEGLPDTYEQPRHQVDLIIAQKIGKHVDVKGTAENIFDSPVRFTQGESDDGDNMVDRYNMGRGFSLGVTVTN